MTLKPNLNYCNFWPLHNFGSEYRGRQ